MNIKHLVWQLKSDETIALDAEKELDYTVDTKADIESRLKKLDRTQKLSDARLKQAEIDTLLGYPMEFTKHVFGIQVHPDTGDIGLLITPIHNMKTGKLVDIESEILTSEDLEILQSDWMPSPESDVEK